MSKVIAVLEEPEWCYICPFYKNSLVMKCALAHRIIYSVKLEGRPNWCPLKEMPKKREEKSVSEVGLRDYGFIDGWNACIDEMPIPKRY